MKLQTKKKWKLVCNILAILGLSVVLTACPGSESIEEQTPTISITPSELVFDGTIGCTRTVTIKTTGDWSVNIQNVSWLKIDYLSGSGNTIVNFTTTEENVTNQEQSNEVVFTVSSNGNTSNTTLKVRQSSIYDNNNTVDVIKAGNNYLEMTYGFFSRMKTGNNTKYFMYNIYTTTEYSNNLQGDKNRIEDAARSWTRMNVMVNEDCVISKLDCQPNTSYTLLAIPYTSNGQRGSLAEPTFSTKPAVNQPFAEINNVRIENGQYKWDMVCRNNCRKYYIYACSSSSEFNSFKENSQVDLSEERRGMGLAWQIYNLANGEEHSPGLQNSTYAKDSIYHYSTNNETRDLPYRSGDRYLEIVTWGEDDNGNRSGILYDLLYTVENGRLVPVANRDKTALRDSDTDPYLTVDNSSMSFGYSSDSGSFTISSNVSWTVTSNATWCTISPTSGSDNGTVTVKASENTTTADRSATITVTGGGITRTITVTQGHNGYVIPGEDDNPLPQYIKKR